jgi:sn-glycerol 3-phosphate transport system substrate-binding protein
MNTTLLEKAGLDPKGPENWAELADYCKTIKEKTGAYGVSMYSYIWVLEAFMLSNGTSTLTADEMKSNIDTPEAKEVFAFFQDLAKKGYIRCVAGADSGRVNADYMNQNAAMWFTSTADLTQILSVAEENGFKINTCFIPANKTHGVPTGGCNLVMTTLQSEDEKEASWQFIKWMTETKQAAYAHAYTGYVPSRKSAAATEEIQALYKKTPQFKVALDQLELYSSGRPMNPGYSQVSEEFVAAMDAIWVNGADVESTVSAIDEKIVRMHLLD